MNHSEVIMKRCWHVTLKYWNSFSGCFCSALQSAWNCPDDFGTVNVLQVDWDWVVDVGDWDCDDAKDEVVVDSGILEGVSFDSNFKLLAWSESSVKTACCTFVLSSSVDKDVVDCALVDTSAESSSLSLAVPISSITIRFRGF